MQQTLSLTGDGLPADTATIARWPSPRNGNSPFHATLGPIATTVNGQRAATFDGTKRLDCPTTISRRDMSFFAVIRADSVAGTRVLYGSDQIAVYHVLSAPQWGVSVNGFTPLGGALIAGNMYLLEVHCTGPTQFELVTNGASAFFNGNGQWFSRGGTTVGMDPSGVQGGAFTLFALEVKDYLMPAGRLATRNRLRTKYSVY